VDHFAILTPHEQLVKHKNLKMVLHNLLYSKGYNFQERVSTICGTSCGPLQISTTEPFVSSRCGPWIYYRVDLLCFNVPQIVDLCFIMFWFL